MQSWKTSPAVLEDTFVSEHTFQSINNDLFAWTNTKLSHKHQRERIRNSLLDQKTWFQYRQSYHEHLKNDTLSMHSFSLMHVNKSFVPESNHWSLAQIIFSDVTASFWLQLYVSYEACKIFCYICPDACGRMNSVCPDIRKNLIWYRKLTTGEMSSFHLSFSSVKTNRNKWRQAASLHHNGALHHDACFWLESTMLVCFC